MTTLAAWLEEDLGLQTAEQWLSVLSKEVLECPVNSAVGIDSLNVIEAAQELINMLRDRTKAEIDPIRICVKKQCDTFYFG